MTPVSARARDCNHQHETGRFAVKLKVLLGMAAALAVASAAHARGVDSVDSEAPVVTLATGSRPADGPLIVAAARDNVGVVTMHLYLDDELRSTSNVGTISHGWTGVSVGKHRIRITATDAANNTGTVTGTIRIK
jgi:hypothetical protein